MPSGLTPPVGAGDHTLGPDDAPITLVEYGDFECPYCANAHVIVKSIREQLGDRLRFVFREFPLSEAHPHAEHAAEAAEVAAAQGRFWQMHDLLFEHQHHLSDGDLARYAQSIGVDASAVASALDEGTFSGLVRQQFMSGVRSGVNGTPTFFVNGHRLDVAWSDETTFLSALEAMDSSD
jgi:protein-disulfide isomerase